MTYTYTRRQDNLIDKDMVEVSFVISCRRGCTPIIGYEYFVRWGNAMNRANELCKIVRKCLVCDFAGRCEKVEIK